MNNLWIKQTGFTLIELLISSAILSMVLFVGSYSYSLFASNWSKELGSFSRTNNFIRDVELLRRVINATSPLIVGETDKNSLYFDGNSVRIRAMSEAGMFNDTSVIYEIMFEEKSDGNYKMKYQEIDSNEILLDAYTEELDYSSSKVIIDNVNSFDIQYFGWINLRDKSVHQSGISARTKKWFPEFRADDRGLYPESYRIEVKYRLADQYDQALIFSVVLPMNPERGINDGF